MAQVAHMTRSMSPARLQFAADDVAQFECWDLPGVVDRWTLETLARVILLLHATTSLKPSTAQAFVEKGDLRGDLRTRQAVLQSLTLLPSPERFLWFGQDACRSHVPPIFEAIACENRYPAAYFPEFSLNHMILTALFIGISLTRILDLNHRITSHVTRVAEAFISERRAAGRPIPERYRQLLPTISKPSQDREPAAVLL